VTLNIATMLFHFFCEGGKVYYLMAVNKEILKTAGGVPAYTISTLGGVQNAGQTHEAGAIRELSEETTGCLKPSVSLLIPLGSEKKTEILE